jgi:hypothetical protein
VKEGEPDCKGRGRGVQGKGKGMQKKGKGSVSEWEGACEGRGWGL